MSMRSGTGRAAIALLFMVAGVSVASTQSLTPKRVLLIHQNEEYSPAAQELEKGLLDRLRMALGPETEFFGEQLEATRLPENQSAAVDWVRTRYAGRGIDVVIFLGSVPMDVLPGVPTVYAGHTPFKLPADAANRAGKVTVWFKVDVRKTISVARRLQPGAKKILVITGSGYADHILLEELRDQLRQSELPVEYLADAGVDDLKDRVSRLSRDTIVLPVSYTRDPKGNIYYTRDVVSSLSLETTAPLYSMADTTIGSGTVGGYVVDFEKMGTVIANIVLQTLGGRTEAQISVPPEDAAAYMFDWRQLERWGFSERDLPNGSIVLYKMTSVWEQYRWRIVGTIALVVAQFFLILGLLILQRKRARAEASLRDMTGKLLESQDDERRRIARDLHDGTGQHLSGMALSIGQVLADFPPGHERLRQLLQDSHLASRQALEEVRTVSYVLHPPILDGLGLVAALRWYFDGLQKRTSLKVYFDAPTDLATLSSEVERALFRITQESINNVLRHSGASSVIVTLANRGKTVALEIHDNGTGMSPEQLAQMHGVASLGVGIAGMRERVRQLRGKFQITSIANGTQVFVSLPIDQEQHVAHSVGR
jgi:signal transduction histidine kinase